MKKPLNLAPVICALLLLTGMMIMMVGCKKEQSPNTETKPDSKIVTYLKSLGYKDEQIIDIGTDYVVSGDIAYPKNAVIGALKDTLPKQVDQTGDGTYVTQNINVIIQVDPTMNGFLAEINAAIAEWNGIAPSRLHFSIFNGAGPAPNLTITDVNLGGNLCGLANAPLNGQPGSLVRINVNLITAVAMSFAQIQQLIVHELGHTIGFRHTNWQALGEPQNGADPVGTNITAVQIPGTPATDANSVMNGATCNNEPAALSNSDILAFRYLYSPIYARTEFSNPNVTTWDHYGTRGGETYVDGTIDETYEDITIRFYSDFACTQPLTLAAPLTVLINTSSTHGPSNTLSFAVGAGVNSYLVYSQAIVEVVVTLSDTIDDNQFNYDVTGNNNAYFPLSTRL